MTHALSLRGGGMKGYATAILLCELEKVLKKPLCEAFDLIAGTSVGGILATGLALKLPTARLVEFFEVEGPVIFSARKFGRTLAALGRPRFKIDNLTAALERHFDAPGAPSLMAHTFTKLMVCSTRYRGLEARLWKSWKHTDMRAVHAAASSAAAITYFAPIEIADYAHGDGGYFANNPSHCVAIECRKLWPAHNTALIDIACPSDHSQFEPHGGLLNAAPHIVDVLIGAGEDCSNYVARKILGGSGRLLSIAPPLLEASHDIGNASKQNLRELRRCAEYGLDRNIDDILKTLGR
jgi:hypothetical protein